MLSIVFQQRTKLHPIFRLINHKGSYVFLASALHGLYSLIITLYIAKILSPVELGKYYYISSIVAFILISDFGLSGILKNFFSQLKINQRLYLYFYVKKIYFLLIFFSFVLSFSLLFLEFDFIEKLGIISSLVTIQFFWIQKLKLTFLEASMKIKEVAKIKIFHTAISLPFVIIFLSNGYYYLVHALYWGLACITYFILQTRLYNQYFSTATESLKSISSVVLVKKFKIFGKSIFELLSNYCFIYSPVIFSKFIFNDAFAGKFGITLISLNFLLIFASSWYQSSIPETLNSFTTKTWIQRYSVLREKFLFSILFFVIFSSLFYFFINLLGIDDKFLEINYFYFYVIAFCVYHLISFETLVLRKTLVDHYSIPFFLMQIASLVLLVFYKVVTFDLFILINMIPLFTVLVYIYLKKVSLNNDSI